MRVKWKKSQVPILYRPPFYYLDLALFIVTPAKLEIRYLGGPLFIIKDIFEVKRQNNFKRCAFLEFTFHIDLASMILDDLIAY